MNSYNSEKEKHRMKIKTLNKSKTIANINGLSKGDKAYCGPYGTVQCVRSASESKSGLRLFKVTGSVKLANRGNWTMKALREAIQK